MNRLALHLKVLHSSFVWAACGLTVLLVGLACVLQPWRFVTEVEWTHIRSLYEYIFPLVAALIMSQLLTVELDSEAANWFMSLPYRSVPFLLVRWLLALGMLAALYGGSLAFIQMAVLPVPVVSFSYQVLPPALWLGHLGLLCSLIGKTYAAGISVSFFYWITESITAGAITRKLFLFAGGAGSSPELVWNRNALLLGSLLALLLSLYVFGRRSFFTGRST